MRFFNSRYIIGLVVIVAGLLLAMDVLFDDNRFGSIFAFWPVIPLLIGLDWVISSFRHQKTSDSTIDSDSDRSKVHFSWGQFISGFVLMTIGSVYLSRTLGIMPPFMEEYVRHFWRLLPAIIIIFIGISLLKGKAPAGSGSKIAVMSGVEIGKNSSWRLESGSYLAFMGGMNMNMLTAEIPEGETVLDLTAVMGGFEVIIPHDLPVIYEGSAILGGVEFLGQEDGGIITSRKIEHNLAAAGNRVVRIQARAIMGGVEIKAMDAKNTVSVTDKNTTSEVKLKEKNDINK